MTTYILNSQVNKKDYDIFLEDEFDLNINNNLSPFDRLLKNLNTDIDCSFSLINRGYFSPSHNDLNEAFHNINASCRNKISKALPAKFTVAGKHKHNDTSNYDSLSLIKKREAEEEVLKSCKGVLIVGRCCSGKTTLLNKLKENSILETPGIKVSYFDDYEHLYFPNADVKIKHALQNSFVIMTANRITDEEFMRKNNIVVFFDCTEAEKFLISKFKYAIENEKRILRNFINSESIVTNKKSITRI